MTEEISDFVLKIIDTTKKFIVEYKESFIESYSIMPNLFSILETYLDDNYKYIEIEFLDGLDSAHIPYKIRMHIDNNKRVKLEEIMLTIDRSDYIKKPELLRNYLKEAIPDFKKYLIES